MASQRPSSQGLGLFQLVLVVLIAAAAYLLYLKTRPHHAAPRPPATVPRPPAVTPSPSPTPAPVPVVEPEADPLAAEPAAPPVVDEPELAPEGELPESLGRQMIVDGVAAVHERVMACGSRAPAGGAMIKLHVEVRPDGRVDSAEVRDDGGGRLGDCVAAAMRRAHFAASQNGGSFSYPFRFAGP